MQTAEKNGSLFFAFQLSESQQRQVTRIQFAFEVVQVVKSLGKNIVMREEVALFDCRNAFYTKLKEKKRITHNSALETNNKWMKKSEWNEQIKVQKEK